MGISLEELVTELLTGLSPRNLLPNLVESIASERDGHEVPRSGFGPRSSGLFPSSLFDW